MIVDYKKIIKFLKGEDLTILKADNLYITIFDYAILHTKIKPTPHNEYELKEFLKNFEILEFSKKEAKVYAKLKRKYKISDINLLKASIAIAHNLHFLTDEEELKKIKELKKI